MSHEGMYSIAAMHALIKICLFWMFMNVLVICSGCSDTAAGYTDQLHPTVAEGISHLKLSDTLQATERSLQRGNNEVLYFVDSPS